MSGVQVELGLSLGGVGWRCVGGWVGLWAGFGPGVGVDRGYILVGSGWGWGSATVHGGEFGLS